MAKPNLRRRPPSRKPKERMLVLTEGRVTEIEYLRHACSRFGLPKELVCIEKGRATQAKGLVDEASDRKRKNERDARKGKDALIDHWWVVVDTEGRPGELRDAVQKAKARGICLALSDPSFEFWLRLHFGYTTTPFADADSVMRELREKGFLPGYNPHNKHPDMEILFPLLPDAMTHARQLRKNHTSKGFDQPLTDCDLLMDALGAQADPNAATFERKPFEASDLSMHVLYR